MSSLPQRQDPSAQEGPSWEGAAAFIVVGLSDRGEDHNEAPEIPLRAAFIFSIFLFKLFKPLHFEAALKSNLAVTGN